MGFDWQCGYSEIASRTVANTKLPLMSSIRRLSLLMSPYGTSRRLPRRTILPAVGHQDIARGGANNRPLTCAALYIRVVRCSKCVIEIIRLSIRLLPTVMGRQSASLPVTQSTSPHEPRQSDRNQPFMKVILGLHSAPVPASLVGAQTARAVHRMSEADDF